MTRHPIMAALFAAGALVLAACGGGGHAGMDNGSSSTQSANRTLQVDMVDIAYQPPSVTVRAGETVRFLFANKGRVDHDAFLGDEAAQQQHENEMMTSSDMHNGGSDAITVAPGKTGALTHTFKTGENVLIGCHELDHYAAGMKIQVNVT